MGADGVRARAEDIRSAVATASARGPRPVSEFTVEISYEFESGKGGIVFSIEDEAPHRITSMAVNVPEK